MFASKKVLPLSQPQYTIMKRITFLASLLLLASGELFSQQNSTSKPYLDTIFENPAVQEINRMPMRKSLREEI